MPGQQPLGPVRLDANNEIVKKASVLTLFNEGRFPPVDCKTNKAWTINTTYSGAFSPGVEAGKKCVHRTDLDEAGNVLSFPSTVAAASPFFVLIEFCILAAPSSGLKGIFCISDFARGSNPCLLLTSEDASSIKLYFAAEYKVTGIDAQVGKWHRLAFLYNGSTWIVLLNVPNYRISGTATSGGTRDYHYIGSGYNAELPCAFSMYISGNSNLPEALAKSWMSDPYQFLIPA